MMKVKLIFREGSNVIPVGEELFLHSAVVGVSAFLEPIENNGMYHTSTIQNVGIVGNKISIETRNTRYEFEVIR